MKQALLILSVLGMGMAQASGAVETTFQPNNTLSHTITNSSASANYGSSRNIYSTNSGAHVYSNDEISQAIDSLSAHAKQKESQLASLTSRLSYEQRQQQPVSRTPDRNSAPAIAAANAARVALSRSSGYCARYVRKALQSAGYQFTPNPSAYQYATRGTLAQAVSPKLVTICSLKLVMSLFLTAPQVVRMVISKSLMAVLGYLTSAKTVSILIVARIATPRGAIRNMSMMHQIAVSTLRWLINNSQLEKNEKLSPNSVIVFMTLLGFFTL